QGALMSSSSSLILPAVSWPASNAVIGQLQDQLDTSPLYMDPETLSQLRLNASSPALLVFRLPYGIGADLLSAKEILSGNDEVIGQVLNIMKSQSVPYTAIYTALRPSREAASLSVEAGLGGGRSLLQVRGGYKERGREREKQRRIKERAGTYPPVEFKEGENSCILLWAKSLSVSILRSGRWEEHDLTPSTFGEGVTPKLDGSRCDKTKARYFLPIQGFNVSGGEFSYASDCAGFFSPGIWMGLITSLLMVLVLTYGLHMIMQLRTMDRFDDPKGPAISVPQTE
ncbi:V-type proton ATPase subunit S1-like, partial [Neolamprologus brichardi]|uniref:V-type proton ATPase subunit S1-like n=1 Tax=Neolamprologus brichardi TaxID=32507 RepID=UPI0016439C02